MALSVSDGDSGLWPQLWSQLQPLLEDWVRTPTFLGRVSARDDYCRDIVLLAWEKLQERDYNKLRSFFRNQQVSTSRRSSDTASAFRTWLFRVVKNIGIDYMRQLPEYQGRSRRRRTGGSDAGTDEEERSDDYWRSVVTLHSQVLPVHRSFTAAMTAQRLLEYLDESVSPRQRTAAEMVGEGASYERIAEVIGLSDPRDVERVVRRSVDRLAYRKALELWMRNYSNAEIAEALALRDAHHAQRIVAAAKELLKRHFR